MKFLSSDDRFYFQDGLTIHIHGEGDDSYAVFEKDVAAAPISVDQYVVHARNPEKRLFCLIRFLAESDFELGSVMKRITESDYSNDDTARFNDVEIVHRRVTEDSE